jgi:predicted O-methyltransferase YrrM
MQPSGSEEIWASMARNMANNERSGIAQRIAKIASELPEFSSFGKMLDLGGGPGLNGLAIVSKHPSMKGVIFDRPPIVKVAEEFIKEYEMEERMTVMGGDYLQDSIGNEYDLILSCATLNYAKHDIDTTMKKIYDALNPNGVVMSFHDGLTNEKTKPELMVLGCLSMDLMGENITLEQGFLAESMLRVGFKSVRSVTLDTPMGAMDLDIGRK